MLRLGSSEQLCKTLKMKMVHAHKLEKLESVLRPH